MSDWWGALAPWFPEQRNPLPIPQATPPVFPAEATAAGLDPNQYRATTPPTAGDKMGELLKALLPQSIQGPSHEDWQAYFQRENAARVRGEGYYGPTPNQTAQAAAALFGPLELGSMLPGSILGVGAKTLPALAASPAAMALARKVVPLSEGIGEAATKNIFDSNLRGALRDAIWSDKAIAAQEKAAQDWRENVAKTPQGYAWVDGRLTQVGPDKWGNMPPSDAAISAMSGGAAGNWLDTLRRRK